MARRTGRRPGNPDTREAILAAAREAFAERGFDAASIRAIAAGAGVDPALVHHYFGTKDQLFLAAMNSPIDPQQLIPQVWAGDRDQLGERLVRVFLGIWDSPAGAAAVALLRSAVSNEWTARLMREFVLTQVLRQVVKAAGIEPEEARIRVPLVGSQLVGLAMVRYIIKIEPFASTPTEALVAAVGPTVQRYLTDELPGVFDHLA
ncbi:TetR family transcriptional regulator [Micromonospora sp. NPDC049679]|uniref:TetR/AcrR family transcriptional regulator n=1 Tax=Micromonospora sp. NPDC049679 TaxID=3155920 RepID=UPI0033ED140F